MNRVRNATNKSATSELDLIAYSVPVSPPAYPGYPTTGFGSLDLKDLLFVDPTTRRRSTFPVDYREGITDLIYEKNMTGVSTLTIQLDDPNRTLLRSLVRQGMEVVVHDSGRELSFSFSQLTKASDQLQMVFESTTIYRLRNQWNASGTVTTSVSTGVTEFMASLVGALNYAGSPYGNVGFVAPDYATVWGQLVGNAKKPIVKVGLGRGTKTDPYEDSWTCMSRIASSVGWRLWENNNTVYFGPDEYWLGLLTGGVPPVNKAMGAIGSKMPKLREFTPTIQLIDYDWDVQKPYGQASVTAMMDNWIYDIGEIVDIEDMGVASGQWMVFTMQRDAFMPQASMTLQVPMPFASVFDPTSLPLPGFPLVAHT